MTFPTPFYYTETSTMKQFRILLMAFFLTAGPGSGLAQDHEDHEEEGGPITLSTDERKAAGIETIVVTRRALDETVRVPAEVVLNAYASAKVTPRITAQVVARHARLGDRVEKGQPLVTLSSTDMAEAQGALIVASQEWQRVRSLGRKTVSQRRYTEAQVAQQLALAKVQAYGMTREQAEALMKSRDAGKATGEFDLLAPRSGSILRDDFIVGELIEPGRVLFEISDESVLWVEARTIPSALPDVPVGATARISPDGEHWINGKIIQLHHQLDETTRTRALRIEVDNADDRLHPGQFVEAEIVTGTQAPALAIPRSAITLINGSPAVFRLYDGQEFQPQTIEIEHSSGNWIIVGAGLSEGDEIAAQGVFHLKSLLLKSSIGDEH